MSKGRLVAIALALGMSVASSVSAFAQAKTGWPPETRSMN